ncbi:MAG: LacI family DNA-binding transcriptional regulator [Anaerolineaceae bacterium]
MVNGQFSKKRRVTIKQVAEAANVSTQTISRVINNRPDVAEETRERVLNVIENLGYHPNAVARSLIRQRSMTIGVVTSGLQHVGPSRTLRGITEEAEYQGYTLILKELPRFDFSDVRPVISTLIGHQVDGILWAVQEVGNNREWVNEHISEIHVPIIFLSMQSRPGLTIVGIDNYKASFRAVQHLLDQGYRHIGHISGPLDWWEARERKTAWKDCLERAGIKVTDQHSAEGNWSPSSGDRAMKELLVKYPDIDAVFSANDQMAISVLLGAAQAGYRVPQDLGVAGFDNIPESAYFNPPLTTVHQDQFELGRTGVRELIKIIHLDQKMDGYYEPHTITLEPELIIRESSIRRKTTQP